MRVGGLINNIRGWALELCVYICIVWIVGGESWCTIKDLQAPFPDLKTGHVDHLLFDYFSRKFYDNVINCIFLR